MLGINISQTLQCRFQLFVNHMLDKKLGEKRRTISTVPIYQRVPLEVQYLRKKG